MNNKISIITVSYNSDFLIERTIRSIHSQIFNDFEYIIIDGQSTDNTPKIIEMNKYKITKFICEPDNGIYDAMNKGLKAATGEYVIFMNAGDTFYEDTTLEKIPFDGYPDADIFYGETMILNPKGEILGLKRKKLPPDLNWMHLKDGLIVSHQSIFVKREIAPLFNLHYKLSADVEWVLECLKKSKQTVFTHSIISNFMEGGASTQRHRESLLERFVIMKNEFGLIITLLKHLSFLGSNILIYIGLRKKYRDNYLKD